MMPATVGTCGVPLEAIFSPVGKSGNGEFARRGVLSSWRAGMLVVVLFALFAGGAACRANPLTAVSSYAWHRVTDLCDILRCGLAVGPAAGAEFAVGETIQAGAYAVRETGVSFPHVLPPLWPLTHADGKPVFRGHEGSYATACLGPLRTESHLARRRRFRRPPHALRAQVGLGVAHLYASASGLELVDFLAGLLGKDPLQDDSPPKRAP